MVNWAKEAISSLAQVVMAKTRIEKDQIGCVYLFACYVACDPENDLGEAKDVVEAGTIGTAWISPGNRSTKVVPLS